MSLIATTQITAIATALLALFAIITTGFAYFAFQAQSEQVSILKDQEERAIEERRRGQAARVYLTEKTSPRQAAIPSSVQMPGGRAARGQSAAVTVHNTSEQPVYDLRIHWVDWARKVQAGVEDGAARGARRYSGIRTGASEQRDSRAVPCRCVFP
jgi:hypothetical protein